MPYQSLAMKKQLVFPRCDVKTLTKNKYPMKPTLNDKVIVYLTLLSGLALSAVAVYYSVAGLTAIFSAAVIPIIVMGVSLEISKIVATIWLKQNWNMAPISIKVYLCLAIAMLMLITSMGIFGFLSKAHSDQSLVSGDVQSKIAAYDEKIKTSKENIDANRKAIKQLDEAVDQVMARSDSEKGADKAVAVRKGQAKERARLQTEITVEQEAIARLNEARAPIAAEVRKVEAEVGPIKYIAAFVYGNTDPSILERAVTWVIILIIVVFDPLALIMLIASQVSFQNFREREKEATEGDSPEKESDVVSTATVTDLVEGDSPRETNVVVDTKPLTVTNQLGILESTEEEDEAFNAIAEKSNSAIFPISSRSYVQNEEQTESGVWTKTTNSISQDDYIKASQDRLEMHIDEIVELVKTNQLSIDEVPGYIQQEVRSKL